MNLALPFVGRRKEVAELVRLHAQRKHVLILGPAGVGKTAFSDNAASRLHVLICPHSVRLSEICNSLECQMGLDSGEERLIQRKSHLLHALREAGKTVVFDGVAWTTPKLSSFLECVMERTPVWIATRSEHSWDIGHIWLLLVRFVKIEIKPFHPAETRELIEAAIRLGHAPAGAVDAVERLHHLSAGVPEILVELIKGLATGHYDPHKKFDLRLLDLDRRIQNLAVSDGPKRR
jgi:hypothetical protein